jgi:hypothetical protein
MLLLPRQHTNRSARRLLQRVPRLVYLAVASDTLYCAWCSWCLAAELSRIRLCRMEVWTDSKTQVCKKWRQTIHPPCTCRNTSTVKVATDIQTRSRVIMWSQYILSVSLHCKGRKATFTEIVQCHIDEFCKFVLRECTLNMVDNNLNDFRSSWLSLSGGDWLWIKYDFSLTRI